MKTWSFINYGYLHSSFSRTSSLIKISRALCSADVLIKFNGNDNGILPTRGVDPFVEYFDSNYGE